MLWLGLNAVEYNKTAIRDKRNRDNVNDHEPSSGYAVNATLIYR